MDRSSGDHILVPARMAPLHAPWMLLLAVCTLLLTTGTMAQVSLFLVLRSDEVIGHVVATRQALPNGEAYSMESHCELDVIWKQVVRTALRTEYTNGELSACHTSVRVNGSVRDSSSMVRGRADCYVHPDAPFDCTRRTHWTTSRLYFEEPVGQTIIFVESVLQDCRLERSAPGTYILTFPNGHENHYVYRNGLLQEIRVERPLLDLVFRRA